jgi:hypothetical protein
MSTANRADVLEVIKSLSPQEKFELGVGPAPATPTSQTPKLSPLLDKVAEADIPRVVQACRQGLKAAADDPSTGEDKVGAPLGAVSAGLLAAAQANSLYRKKPLVHSLRVISEYLQSEQAAAKRAAKLRVPADHSTSTPAGAGK